MTYRVRVVPKKRRRRMQQGKTTKTPYGPQVIESCLTWPLVKERIFCGLPKSVLTGEVEVFAQSLFNARTKVRSATSHVERIRQSAASYGFARVGGEKEERSP
jgi:hypothetical protein